MSQATEQFDRSNNSHPPEKVYGRAAVPAGPDAAPAGEHPSGERPTEERPGDATAQYPQQRSTEIPPSLLAAPPYVAPTLQSEPSTQQGDGATYRSEHRQKQSRRRSAPRLVAMVLVIVAVFGGAAVGYSFLRPTVYGAQVDFVITARPELSDAAVDRAMLTQTMIVTSDSVLEPVAAQSGMSVTRLRREVSAEILNRSNVLRITVADRQRASAVTVAQLVSSTYVARSASISAVAPRTSSDLTPQTQVIVLTPATALDKPLQPRPLRALAAGVLLGLLVAAGVIIVLLRPRFLARPSAHWE